MNYFKKKQWIRIAVCAVLVVAATLYMTGVFGGQESLIYPPPTRDATVKGFGGDVTVHVTLNEDQTVKTLTVETPDETEGLGKLASEEAFTSQFIGKSAPFAIEEIEAVSGATTTTQAVLKALNWAVTGEEPADSGTAQETAGENAEAGTGANKGVYGAYRATVENPYSKITVMAAAKDGVLTEVKIRSEGEQDMLTDEIRKEWAQAILESGSAAPDAVTGASLTASAGSVKEAMTEILNRIAGSSLETPAAEAAGSGTAGSGKPSIGAYRATVENVHSRITVIAAVKDGALTEVKILSEGEEDRLTDGIRKEWAQAIVESGSAAPDAITGATLTVSAASVTEAVNKILEMAAGK